MEELPFGHKYMRYLIVFLILLPVIVQAFYIFAFGVNVVFWDEWVLVPLVDKMYQGTLSFADLFAQHNEHRYPVCYTIQLILIHFTHFNDIYLLYFSLIVATASFWVLYKIYSKNTAVSNLSLLQFVPVSWLFFSPRQFENILWGFQLGPYLCVLGLLLSIYLLLDLTQIGPKLALAVMVAIISTFSFFTGLLVWPVGLALLLLTKKDTRITLLWSAAGMLVCAFYFNGWSSSGSTNPLLFIGSHPLTFILYLLANLGSIASPLTAMAIVAGTFLLSGLLVIFFLVWRSGEVQTCAPAISLIVFSLLTTLSCTVARSYLGVDQAAQTSRYLTFTMFSVIGFYLLVITLFRKHRQKTYEILNTLLLAAIVVMILTGYAYGLYKGYDIHGERSQAATVLLNYTTAGDQELLLLYPQADYVRDLAPVLERYNLNVFYDGNA